MAFCALHIFTIGIKYETYFLPSAISIWMMNVDLCKMINKCQWVHRHFPWDCDLASEEEDCVLGRYGILNNRRHRDPCCLAHNKYGREQRNCCQHWMNHGKVTLQSLLLPVPLSSLVTRKEHMDLNKSCWSWIRSFSLQTEQQTAGVACSQRPAHCHFSWDIGQQRAFSPRPAGWSF